MLGIGLAISYDIDVILSLFLLAVEGPQSISQRRSPDVRSDCRPQPSVLSSSNPDPSKSAISEYESPSVENLMVKSVHALHSIGVFLVPIPVVL